MSKSQEAFSIKLSLDATHDACMKAAGLDGWNIKNWDHERFFLSQQISFLDRFFRFPSDCIIFLRREKKGRTRVELYGKIRGFGPMQRRRVKRALAGLKAAIETAAT